MSIHPVPMRPRRVLAGLLSATLPAALLAAAPSAQADTGATSDTFTWKVSQQFVDHFSPAAWNQSTLEASDGATLDEGGATVFTEGTGGFDLATGEGTASYTGTITGTFVVGQPQYSIALSDPEIAVEDGKGEIRADVAWTVPVEDQEGSAEDVLVTTFDVTSTNWSASTLTATPHFADVLPAGSDEASALDLPDDQPIGGRSFAPEFLRSLGAGVRAHFYASGGGGDAKKAPAPFTAVVPEKETEQPEEPEEPEEPEAPAETAISAADVETSHGRHTVVTAEVPGARGRVTLTLGGEKKSGWVTGDEVSFVVPRDLTAKIYTARWNYLGNAEFAPSTDSSRVIMRSAPTSARASFDAPETRRSGRADITVTNTASSWPSPTGQVKLRLSRADGRSITHVRHLRWGRTHVTLPQMSQGTWKAEVIYDGAPTTFARTSTTTSMRVAR